MHTHITVFIHSHPPTNFPETRVCRVIHRYITALSLVNDTMIELASYAEHTNMDLALSTEKL